MSIETIGDHIKQSRKDAGMTQVELAARAGLSHSSVHNWEVGRNQPTTATLKKLSGVINIGESWITAATIKKDPMPKISNSKTTRKRVAKKSVTSQPAAITWIRQHPDLAPMHNEIQKYWKELRIEVSSTDMDEVAVMKIVSTLNELTLNHANKLINVVYGPENNV